MKKSVRVGVAVAIAAGFTAAGLILNPTSYAITAGGVNETTIGSNMAIGGCTGSLVSREWVITAWHCYDGGKVTDEIGFWGNLDFWHGNKVNVVKVCHQYDMAMVRIDPPLPEVLPEGVSIAEIHTSAPPVGATVTIKGFGEDEYGTGHGGGILRSTDVQVVNAWANGFGDAYGGPTFTVNKLPGGGMTAHGDSGGPAFYEGKIVGVASNSDGEGANYSKVEPHLDWIRAAMENRLSSDGGAGASSDLNTLAGTSCES